MVYALEATSIKKSYRDKQVLNEFEIHVQKGDVYGLVGKNGAGKTTFFKILLGLISADSGTIELFGSSKPLRYNDSRMGLSGVIETPAFYPHMSGQQNLVAYCLLRGIAKTQIFSVMERVGLGDVGNKHVSKYSLGMKQRLGIARSIIAGSKLVILDEPTNGLDPAGIIDFRKLVADLNQNDGVTFIISSHYLTELEKITNRFGLLVNGRIQEEAPLSELQEQSRYQGETLEEYILNVISPQGGGY
jgi:ABC-2 type transport system ATP-binding protein